MPRARTTNADDNIENRKLSAAAEESYSIIPRQISLLLEMLENFSGGFRADERNASYLIDSRAALAYNCGVIFEWNENKAKSNLRKHKISFEEAETIFDDPLLVTFTDESHSIEEERLISIGLSKSIASY